MCDIEIKLPKISVLSLDGDLLNWNTFWKQFEIAIHSKEQLTVAEKLVFLMDSLKEGPARHVIEGLTQTSENYLKQSHVYKNDMTAHSSFNKLMSMLLSKLLPRRW